MANVSFQLIGTSIYCNFTISKKQKFRKKTGFTSHQDDWKKKSSKIPLKDSNKKFILDKKGNKTFNKIPNLEKDGINEKSKAIKLQLDQLKKDIIFQYNNDFPTGLTIDNNWFEKVIQKSTSQNVDEVEFFIYHINESIKNAPFKKIPQKNGKYKVGLSDGRIKGIKQFKNIFETFEIEKYNSNRIRVTSITDTTITDFEQWMNSKEYSINYIGKHLSNFKMILREIKNIELNIIIKDIKIINEEKESDDIIFLNFDELQKIKELNLDTDYLINARKWLLIGCNVGQRVSDLLESNTDKISIIKGRKVFSITQKKTKTKVIIPITKEIEEIIDTGFPRKISDTKLREYFKKICEKAEINELVKGRVKESKHGITKLGYYPKWKLISTHVCRRSFASNYYGIIPTSLLKNITGHSTESMFLVYIGKPQEDLALEMFDYLDKIPQTPILKLNKESDLKQISK